MTGDIEPRPEHPVIQVPPAVRLDEASELEVLRAELARYRAGEVQPAPARRVDRFGRWERTREDGAQPLRTAASDGRRTAAADLIVAAKGLGVIGLLLAGAVALVVVLTVLYGLWRIALRFAAWAADGNALLGGVALVVASIALTGCGLWLFLRLTDRRRADR